MFIKVHDQLYIVKQDVKNNNVVEKRNKVNHIWLFDRSGSMYGSLSQLTSQLISLSKLIPEGDTITLGYFSSENDYNFIVKGYKITENDDYTVIENAIKRNSTTLGCTCFSEILMETSRVVEDLSVYSNTFSFNLFTDGCPVVSNYQKEINNIFNAIASLKGKLSSAMLIGYSNYYNKNLMSNMAEKLGAMLIHSSMIDEYSAHMVKLLELSGSSSPKQEVIPSVSDPIAVFTVTDQGVVVNSVDKETGMVYISPQGDRTSIYYVSKTKPEDDNYELSINSIGVDDDIIKSVYASALVLTQQTKTDIAMEIVGGIGDKNFVDVITNAYTIEEFGKVEKLLDMSVYNESCRFTNGRVFDYLPPKDAFCVFDVMSKLMVDEDSYFYPYHHGFVYNKISNPTKINDEYSKFVPYDNAKGALDDFVWHESRLNLSVRVTINGYIDLKEKDGVNAASVGLADRYPVFIYRTYSFINDGVVNVKVFYVSTSQETYEYFVEKGIVVDDTRNVDGVYGLDISNLPSINRAMAEGNTSATKLCEYLKRDMEISGELKALKNYLKVEFDNASTFDAKLISEAQKVLLEANGVDVDGGGAYNPKSDAVESTDMYVATKFDIKIKGLSSLPSVNAVLSKIKDNKKRTLSESVVEVGITNYEQFKLDNDDEDIRKLWLNKQISKLKAEQKQLRSYIQPTKFAILLSKKWFDEFTSRDDCTIDYGGWNFTFIVSEQTVKI